MNEDSPEIQITVTPRAQAALDELQTMIAERYPEATFAVYKGHEPAGIYLMATVDIDDVDDVFAVVVDRLVEIQVNEGIPVFVDVRQPRERVLAQFREQQSRVIPAAPSDRIVQNSAALFTHPVVKGTMVPVEMVLAHLARNADFDQLLAHYPELTMDDVRACLAYARTLVAGTTRREEVTTSAAS
jgi:uncharacterized protein (DUF433 family)